MARNLYIESEALEVMTTDAENSFPNECCGFIYGRDIEGKREVLEAVPVENSKQGDQRRRFEISPLQYMKAEQYAIAQGSTLLGVYHSHPKHPAIPSETDRVQAMPWFSYVILNVEEDGVGDITSHELDEERQFQPEIIQTIKSPNSNLT